MTDVEKLKKSMKFLLDYERQENIVLFNPKGKKSIEAVIIKYKREHATEVKVKEMLNNEIAPLRQDIDRILEALNVKKEPEEIVQMEVIKSEKPERPSWMTIESTDELEVYECINGHKISVIKIGNGTKLANIDDGENIEIKSKDALAKLKEQVINMQPIKKLD